MNLSEAVEQQYPPAPWPLQGQMYGAVWAVPRAQCQVQPPEAFEPLTVGGRLLVMGAFVDYQPGSVLVYRELLAGVAVRERASRRLGFTVTHIWVDDEQSLRGGRALWGVPKQLARFDWARDSPRVGAEAQGTSLASADFKRGLALSAGRRVPVRLPNMQLLEGQVCAPDARFLTRVRLVGSDWRIGPDSPLAALGLAGRSPLLGFALEDFQVTLQAARPLG